MNEWTFDLNTETDPIKRLGIHGLRRLLHYGGGGADEVFPFSDYYPDIRQSETLKWTMTDTSVTLSWETADDLNRLMGCQLGDFRYGVGVVPGYVPEPDHPGFYATSRGHLGINGTYFFELRGCRRSESLGVPAKKKTETDKELEGRLKKEALLAQWKTTFGRNPLTVVKCLAAHDSTEDQPKALEIKVTPHTRSASPPRVSAGKQGGLEAGEYGTVYHPALSKWYETQIKADPKDLFLVSFSCLSYVFTVASDGAVGLGIDLPSFSAAAKVHDKWSLADEPVLALWVEGGGRTAAWTIASLLDLPQRSYSVLAPEGHFLFTPEAPKVDVGLVYEALKGAVVPRSKMGEVKGVSGIPLRVQPDGEVLQYALDTLLRNLENGVKWYRDLGGVATLVRSSGKAAHFGLYPNERAVLQQITLTLESEMERQIAKKMKSLFESLVFAYAKCFSLPRPSPANKWADPAREKARDYALRVRLNRAFNRDTILASLWEIQKEVILRSPGSSPPFFDDEEFDWLLSKTAENPEEVRSILLFACEVRNSPKASKAPTQETTSSSAGAVFSGDTAGDDESLSPPPNK